MGKYNLHHTIENIQGAQFLQIHIITPSNIIYGAHFSQTRAIMSLHVFTNTLISQISLLIKNLVNPLKEFYDIRCLSLAVVF